MKKNILIGAGAFVVGVCLTITIFCVYKTLSIYNQVAQNTAVLGQIVSLINQAQPK